MGLIPFVKSEHAELARKLEKKLLSIDKGSGILFVGVSVGPTLDEVPTFDIWVGCDRSMEEGTVNKLLLFALSEEIVSGTQIRTEVHRGVIRG